MGNLCSVQWWLLHNGKCAVGTFGGQSQQRICLIGSIAQEIALEYGNPTFEFFGK